MIISQNGELINKTKNKKILFPNSAKYGGFNGSYKIDSTNDTPILNISIMGLSKESMAEFAKDDNIVLNLGYNGNVSKGFEGSIRKVKVVQTELILICGGLNTNAAADNSGSLEKISVEYINLTLEDIIRRVAELGNFVIDKIKLVNNPTFATAPFNAQPLQIIKKLVFVDGKSFMNLEGNVINIYDEKYTAESDSNIILNFKNGLMKEPEDYTETETKTIYDKIITTFYTNFRNGHIFQVNGNNFSATVKVMAFQSQDFVNKYFVKVVK
jgi:hypothetical protein